MKACVNMSSSAQTLLRGTGYGVGGSGCGFSPPAPRIACSHASLTLSYRLQAGAY